MHILFLLVLAVYTSLDVVVVVKGQDVGGGLHSCGVDTVLDNSTNQCVCSTTLLEDTNEILLAGIFDTTTYNWGPDIFEVTVKLINEGRWGGAVLQDGETLAYSLENANCDETTAVRGYWKLRTQNGNKPMHGIIGARCSGASISLARISGLEGVPQLSPASNSAKLSNSEEFPYFSRLVAPNNEFGEVGALAATLRAFGWERVTILDTDTQFAKDLTTEFRKSWVGAHQDETGDWFGNVAYSDTIRITNDGAIDEDSVRQVLDGIPTDDPTINSRIIVLVAHSQHAFGILEQAAKQNFQPDTIWVGPSSWVGQSAPDMNLEWVPNIPGYLGVAPFRNRDDQYQAFLLELQEWQRNNGKEVMTELPAFAAETVDAIVAMTKAISLSPRKRDGPAIVERLRQLKFGGVSGSVKFTPEGDRSDPKFSIFNAQSVSTDGTVEWADIGYSGTDIGMAKLTSSGGISGVCFAQAGCGLTEAVDDTYPVPPDKLPVWAIALVVIFAVLFIAVAFKYWRSRKSKHDIKKELEAFRDSMVGMRAAECDYIPKVVKKEGDIEQAVDLSGTVAVAPFETPETALWCWQETDQMMHRHSASDIYGNPADCFIKYDKNSNEKLEEAFQSGQADYSPLPGYTVNFANMIQTKTATGFERKVLRVLEKPADQDDNDGDEEEQKEIDLTQVQMGDTLPSDLEGEPQMVLVKGDIVQISTQRSDGWAFGTKLHHADEAIARQLVMVATGAADGVVDDQPSIFADTGWFPLDTTRLPSAEELAALKKNVGDAGALAPPAHWDDIKDKTIVQKHEIKKGDQEYDAVVQAFMSSLQRPHFNKDVKVIKVERIQNLAMWQSYVVKLQTVCYRETGGKDDDEAMRKALERFEKKWLFHGSNFEVVDKILQQCFNRSFCGKNATAYGKGVYFARCSSYSADPTYAVPDCHGNQYMMLCRVVVGEYCRGKYDALTPDVRDAASQSLYDSTVGLLGNDTMANPSIYVTYHDAQAYPEYLVKFRTS